MARSSESRRGGIAAAALLATLLAAPPVATAAERSDDELVADCAKEARERFYDGAAGDHLEVASRTVTRGAAEDVVKLALASGEGRTVRATCKYRGGKLFDVLR
jgi:hypothetical protein